MKIALCFYGLVGSTNFKHGAGDPLDPNLCAKYYKENFFKYNSNIDVFIHSQSYEFKDELRRIYKPCKSVIEKKKNFFLQALIHPRVLLSFLVSLKRFDFKFKHFKEQYKRAKNAFSRWYSTKSVIKLKKSYEKENKFKYDLVFLTRLDWALLKPFILNEDMKNKLTVSNNNSVPGPKNNYKSKIIKNNLTNENGLADYWFVGGSDVLDNFAKLYDKKYLYHISPHISSHQHVKYLKLDLSFWSYRGIDHEMLRRIMKSNQ